MNETVITLNNNNDELSKNQIVSGKTLEEFLEAKKKQGFSDHEIATLRRESCLILGRCSFNQDVGLIVGKIQSGKTTSMTSLCALARENDIPISIVLAGINNTLLNQASDDMSALKSNVSLSIKLARTQASTAGNVPFAVDPNASDFKEEIKRNIRQWVKNDDEHFRQSMILICMKESQNLTNLIKNLDGIDFQNQKILLIDDECDQYGLNNKVRENIRKKENKENPMNVLVDTLRDTLPNHTYLGYTATPQGNIMLPLGETLRPTFANTITPGDDYIGGKDFFYTDDHEENIYIQLVDQNDTEEEDCPIELEDAVKFFIVANAVEAIIKGEPKFRSMLVHPNYRISEQSKYAGWLRDLHTSWITCIDSKDQGGFGSEDYKDLMDDFELTFNSLIKERNLQSIPFDTIVEEKISQVIDSLAITENNTGEGNTASIDYDGPRHNIVIAGKNAERGTVIKNLSVTYIDRSAPISSNNDTLQQRGRFFGYKRGYLEFCKIYCNRDLARFYRDYVLCEEDMWDCFKEIEGKPFDDFRGRLYTPKGRGLSNPARYKPTFNVALNDNWITPGTPHFKKFREKNSQIIKDWGVRNNSKLQEWDESLFEVYDKEVNAVVKPDSPTKFQRHRVGEFFLEDFWNECLRHIQMESKVDQGRFSSLTSFYLKWRQEKSNAEKCTVIQMSPFVEDHKLRERTTRSDFGKNSPEKNRIQNFYSGRSNNPVSGWYPGDRSFFHPDQLTIQLHNIKVWGQREREGANFIDDVYGISMHVPDGIMKKFQIVWSIEKMTDEVGDEIDC